MTIWVVAGWLVTVILAVLASRRIGTLSERLTERENAHRSTMDEVQQLQTQNAMLQIVARSVDVAARLPGAGLAHRRLVPCDRVGLALLTENGQEFQTYTARVQEDERRARPRPDVVFKVDRPLLGSVVRSREPLIVDDIARRRPTSSTPTSCTLRFRVGAGRAAHLEGPRRRHAEPRARAPQKAYRPEHVDAIRPIAEIFAVAVVAQQLQMRSASTGRWRRCRS